MGDASGKSVNVPGVAQRDVLILGKNADSLARCSLDWQGRPCLVATVSPQASVCAVARQIRRQSELTPDALAALWRITGESIQLHGGRFDDVRVNAGAFQNVAHLHLKIFIDEH